MSFMTAKEYYDHLLQIQSSNPPTIALLAAADKPYSINIQTRKAEVPDFLSVMGDHKSGVVYFMIDRYADYMDLAETSCLISYRNLTTKQSFLYPVPFYDIVTHQGKILFPWCIDGAATMASGSVEYSFSFYKVDHEGKKYVYNLNILPSVSRILYTLNIAKDVDPENPIPGEDYIGIKPTLYEELVAKIDELSKAYEIYWEEA